VWCRFRERDDVVDDPERREHLGPFIGWAGDSHDQQIALGTGLLQATQLARVERRESTTGENDGLSSGLRLRDPWRGERAGQDLGTRL
jgi:hypothetical protein